MKRPSVAILLFSLTPSAAAKRKQWLGKARFRENQQLALNLGREAQKALERAPFLVYRFSEREQQGTSFGERFAWAYQQVFQLGYEAVIGLGGDVPGLQQIDFKRVGWQLLSGKAVVGPDRRGGSYLVGMRQEQFDAPSFAALPWQSPELHLTLSHYLGEDSLVELPPLNDVNSLQDLLDSLIAGEARAAVFAQLLWRLARASAGWKPAYSVSFPQYFLMTHCISRRGPPQAA